jgi:hypothetical protein
MFFNKKLKYIHNLFSYPHLSNDASVQFFTAGFTWGHHQALAIPCSHGIDNSKVGFNFNTFNSASRR